ncbi:MAG TPA: hypothetical protein VLT16_06065 [Candidatus Limnocylindrales bacterium]|nr:hypothetical protein [Candidatus Limnocylindrales bacterium]
MCQKTRFSAWMLLCIAGLVLLALPALAQTPRPDVSDQDIQGQNHVLIIRGSVHNDVSPAVRDLPTMDAAAFQAAIKHEAEPARRIPLPPGLKPASDPDPVLQQTVSQPGTAAATLAPTLGLGFDGLGSGFAGFTITGAPPDTNGAVGATQYVQWVNTSFAVFNKSTGALVAGPTLGNALWSGFGGGCQTNNDGDPIVLYDKLANRWIFAQFSVSTTPFLECVAVSTTSDATGTYNRYSFSYSNFDDYPKLGVWPDAYYATFNMFNGTTNAFVGADACAFDRNAMLNGQPATQVCFQQGTSVGGLLPADLDGTTAPPAGSPNYMVFFGTNNLNLFKFHVNFATPSSSTFTGPTVIPVASFTALCNGGTCVPQGGTTNKLDSLADRLMYRLAYRNLGTKEALVVNHSVVAGTSGGVRWYEIDNPGGTPTVAQQSTFAPDSKYRWMGSVAMDKAGDMAMGYSVSSSTQNPAIAYTGRLASDPASTMQAETTIINGTGSQTGTLTRWGDYSAITVDPVDDCTFWYTTEYLKANGTFNWSTRIANFKFTGCGGSPDFSLSASPTSLSVTQGSSGSSTITVNPLNGSTGSVSLSASGLPAGVTASFGTNPTTSSSVLTLTASSTATTGTATVTITGTSGTLTHTTAITLTVNAPAAPDFSLSASPTSLTVKQGSSGSSTISVTDLNGFTGSVTLSTSALPSGVTATFGTNPTTSSSVLTFTASSTATTGTSTITITGTSGTLTHTTSVSLTISSAAATQLIVNPGFETGTATPWTLTAGVLNNSTAEPPHSGSWDAWLDGYGTTHTDSARQTVSIPSTATSATLTFWLHIDTAETTTSTAFDTFRVQVLSTGGTVLATLGTFSNLNHAAGYQQHSFSVLSFKGQTVQIRFLGQEDVSLQTSFVIDDINLNVQ